MSPRYSPWPFFMGSLRVAFVVLCMLWGALASGQQVTIKQVEASGAGANELDATLQALVSAVTQVNGTRVGGLSLSIVRDSARDNKVSTSSDLLRVAAAVTQGAVKSYEVLESTKERVASGQVANPLSAWHVRIRANVPTYNAGAQLKRLRLAIVPFRVAAALQSNANARRYAADFASKLESDLTQSRRFAVLDRKFADTVDQELAQYKTDSFSPEETARIGKKAGTDYLVVGELTRYEVIDRSIHLSLSDSTIAKKSAKAVIQLRLVDVATGQIKYAKDFDTGSKTARTTGAAQGMLDGLAASASAEILNAVYPIAIVAADASSVTLGQGGDTIRVGQRFDVFSLGENLKDPYTGESLGRRENIIGTIEVVSVTDRVSTAKIVDGVAAISAKAGKDMIVRASTVRPIASAADRGASDRRQTVASARKVRHKAVNSGTSAGSEEW